MSQDIPGSDWRRFRELHAELQETFCQRVLEEARAIAASTEGSAHERYIRLYRLMERRDRELARGFNDVRRSTATQQLILLRRMNLLTETHLKSLTDETQEVVRAFSGTRRE